MQNYAGWKEWKEKVEIKPCQEKGNYRKVSSAKLVASAYDIILYSKLDNVVINIKILENYFYHFCLYESCSDLHEGYRCIYHAMKSRY